MPPALAVIAGLVALFVGGELLVRGAVSIARRLRISPLLIGMTVVAFATSAPEMVVSLDSAIHGVPDIALGNVIGTNLANLGLVLGVAAIVAPISANWGDVARDVWVMLAATVALVAVMLGGVVGRFEGALLIGGLAVYILLSYRAELRARTVREDWRVEEVEQLGVGRYRWYSAVLLVLGGLMLLIAGGELLVTGASAVAESLGLSSAVIGLTVVAVGTSAPELATCVVAAARGNDDVALGNAVGSNVFNVLLIVGTASVASPLSVDAGLLRAAFVLLGATAVFAFFAWRVPRISRAHGVMLIGAYLAAVAMTLCL